MADYEEYDEKPGREEGDGQESFHDSSEEEDEAQDTYEQDDFIVDDGEEEDGDDDGTPRHSKPGDEEEARIKRKKKKKKKRHYYEDDDLADDDINLMEEHGYRVDRRKNKRLKRLKKGAPDDDRDEVDEEIRNLNNQEDYEEEHIEERRRRADEPVDFDEDDMNDFIEDRRDSRRRRPGASYVSSEAVRTARSIFGDIDEISQHQSSRAVDTADGEDLEDGEDDDYRPDGRATQPRAIGDESISPGRERSRRYEPASESGAIAKGLAGPMDDKKRIEEIVEKDIPERLQYHFLSDYRKPTDAQIRDEANWIYRRGFLQNPRFRGNSIYESDEAVIEKIVVLLSYIHMDTLDIPFIAMYRQDYVSNLLITAVGEMKRNPDCSNDIAPMQPPRGFNSVMFEDLLPGLSIEHLRGVHRGYDDGLGDWSILWLVLDLDKKYSNLSRRRNKLLDAIEEARRKGVPATILDDVRTLAHTCDDEKDLRDGERHLQLGVDLASSLNSDPVLDDDDEETNNRNLKRPSRRKNRYTEFCKRGYRALTKDLGITSRNFGENLKGVCDYGAGSQVHVPVDMETLPRDSAKVWAIQSGEVAGDILQVSDKAADRILSFARFVLVTEIVSDLQVLQATQRILCRPGAAVVSTTPTEQGMEQVDDTHPLRCITSLSEKKIEDFRGTADFALIHRAVELGFTKLEITFRQDNLSTFRKHLESSILVESSSSPVVEGWNVQRRLVTEDVYKILVKLMIEKVRDDLEDETSQVLRSKLMSSASRRLLLGPASLSSSDGCPRVLAFCVTSEDDEDPDPAQAAKDSEDSKIENSSARRVAPERITMVELDENGEYAAGHELFAAWLRRPMRLEGSHNTLPDPVRKELHSIIMHSKAQIYVIGVGSGQRTPVRLFYALVDVLIGIVDDDGSDYPTMDSDYPTIVKDNQGVKNALQDLTGKEIGEEQKQKALEYLSKSIIFVDESPCRIYSKSVWASKGLSVDKMTLLEKRTIGLGRMAQEPLWVYSAIGHDNELSSRLQFHTYHFYANQSDRVLALNRALVRAVCSVGVDINRSLRLPHTQSMLAFVGGLGVHKANALLKELGNSLAEDERSLKFRKDLWSQKYIGRIVFLCAAAFIRVRDPELHPGGCTRRAREFRKARLNRRSRNNRRRDEDESPLFDPRDDSRIHPEHYMVAGKIADEALRNDRGLLTIELPESDEFSDELRLTAAVLDKPDGLKRLDLHKYAARLADLGRGSLFETVRMIGDEFLAPFHDYRVPLRGPAPAALFYIVTGADPMLMRVGSYLTATNCELREKKNPNDGGRFAGISCRLPMNVRGFIKISEFADDRITDQDIQKLVPQGSSLAVRILDFNFHRFDAELSSKVSIIEDPSLVPNYVPVVDKSHPAFRPYVRKNDLANAILGNGGLGGKEGVNGLISETDIQQKRRTLDIRKTLDNLRNTNKALLQHELFLNVDGNQATVNLRSALPGDILIRPSQYSVNDIVFSCKFASIPGLNNESRTLLHIPCRVIQNEGGGDDEDGVRYKINGVTFEHVDQALDEHIRPILSNLSEAIDHRKFVAGTIAEISKRVLSEKAKDGKVIPYYFGLSETSPAGLVLIFIPGTKTVYTEEILVVPNGYRFRGLLHIHLEKLISWFKLNMGKGLGSGPDGRSDRRNRPSTVGSLTSHAGPGTFGPSVVPTPNPMMPSVASRPRPVSVRDTAPVSLVNGGGHTGGVSGGRPPTAPHQSPYHAPPRSPFVPRGEPDAPSRTPSLGVGGPGGGVTTASGMNSMMAAMSGGLGGGLGIGGTPNMNMGMGMNMNSGMGGMSNNTSSGPAPVRDSAPPPAPPVGGYGANTSGSGPYGGAAPLSNNQQQIPYNGNIQANNIDWSRARPHNEPPPGISNGMGRGGGGHVADFNRAPPVDGRGVGGSGNLDFNRPAGGGRGRGGDGNGFNAGPGPGPNPSAGRGGGRGGGGYMPAWRGQAPVPAWKKKQQEGQ